MPLRVSNLRAPVDLEEGELAERALALLGMGPGDLARWRILRKSLDLRDKARIEFVYTLELDLREPPRRWRHLAASGGVRIEPYEEPPFYMPSPGSEWLEHPPVIVGSGPAGLFAAYFLAQYGYRPLVIERGRKVRDRIRDVHAFDRGGPLDPESNYLFGEGGAGTFSDGKLTCRASGPELRKVLEIFAQCKGKPSLLYEYRPHLGSNRLPAVVKALRRRIESWGGQFCFSCRLEHLDLHAGRVRGVGTSSGYLPADVVVLAIGHSARDTYAMLFRQGLAMVPKPFQFGLRIEQPQEQVNRVQYGGTELARRLGAADYTLIWRGETRVFTFCMCAGGQVIPSVSEPGYFSTNGMSLSRRASPFANSGIMVTLEPRQFPSSHPLAGVEWQRVFERRAAALSGDAYRCPIQWAADYVEGRASTGPFPSSYTRGVVAAELAELVPAHAGGAIRQALVAFDRRWRGEFLRSATLVGPEARGSAPVRIVRDPATLQSPTAAGVYPVGEGAGYAGGIVSAALDGLRAARAIIARYAPLERR
jgi:uncharacterized FAD-dependent dehydrogenase